MNELIKYLCGDLWVVQEKASGSWWRPFANGYTTELVAAGVVDEETANNWASRRHGKDRAVRLSEALVGLGESTVLTELLWRATQPWCPQCNAGTRSLDVEGCCVACGSSVLVDDNGDPRSWWATNPKPPTTKIDFRVPNRRILG